MNIDEKGAGRSAQGGLLALPLGQQNVDLTIRRFRRPTNDWYDNPEEPMQNQTPLVFLLVLALTLTTVHNANANAVPSTGLTFENANVQRQDVTDLNAALSGLARKNDET